MKAKANSDYFQRAGLDPQHTPYVADPAKLKSEFTELRQQLTVALQNFSLSGMGDKALSDSEKRVSVYTVYSSKFEDFTRGDAVLLYAYIVLVENGLLESAGTEMPGGSGSSGSRPGSAVDASGANSDKKSRAAAAIHSLASAISKPVVVESLVAADEVSKATKNAQRQYAEHQARGAELELGRLKEQELEGTAKKIADFESRGIGIPAYLRNKLSKLEAELEEMWA